MLCNKDFKTKFRSHKNWEFPLQNLMCRGISVIYIEIRVKLINKIWGENTQKFNDKAGSM